MAIIPITALLGLVPYLGSIIKIAWSTFLIYVASIKVHNIRAGSAMMVFGALGGIMLLISLGGERAARSMSAQLDGGLDSQLKKLGEQLKKEEEPPLEETRKALGKLLGNNGQPENLGKQREKREELPPEETGKALGSFLGSNGQLENLGKQLEKGEELSPEEAGKALGEFLKGIEKATRQEQ